MSDAIRPTGDNTDANASTNAERADRKETDRTDRTDRTMDKTAEQRDAEKASRDAGTGSKPFGSRTTDDKSAPRGSEKVTPLGSSERTPTASTPVAPSTAAASSTSSTTSSRDADRAIPSPRTGDTTGTDRSERTDRTEQSDRPVHAPEPAPAVSTGAASGNGRRVPQDAENGSLLAHDESDKFSLRLQHAVTGFVDEPRSAVEEADHVLEEVAARFTEAVTKRRATLHGSWESKGTDGSDDTEQLRLALRDYRELTERLLHI
ncbi:hypothetical protein [Streptomyces sp. NBC_00986]|uniref:hypothetical protein n=1 Tax=Streptomyces sp. NBC_00986 TaxID=2903702 RepID=UPI00386E23BD|nr:hypothetical protein OG504_36600 [Streptomyces sp. NBC_00986]